MIDIDYTILIQLVNFLIMLVALNMLLIRPIREVIRKRGELMAEQAGKIDQFNSQASQKVKDYESQLLTARKQGMEIRNSMKEEGTAEEQKIMSAAGDDAAATLRSAQADIDAQVKTAMGKLSGDVETFAQKATTKILGMA